MRIGIDVRYAQRSAQFALEHHDNTVTTTTHSFVARVLDCWRERFLNHTSPGGGDEIILLYDPELPALGLPVDLTQLVAWASIPPSIRESKNARRCTTLANGQFNELIATLGLDVLHLHGALDQAIPLPAHIVTCPYIATMDHLVPRADWTTDMQWYVERLGLLMRATHLVVTNESAIHDVAGVLGLPLHQISVAPPEDLNDFFELYHRVGAKADRNEFRVAMWTPLRPTRSGIADYIEELLPFMVGGGSLAPAIDAQAGAREFRPLKPTVIDLFTPDEPHSDVVRDSCAVLHPTSFEAIHQYRPYDALIYQIGSTPEHHRSICEQSVKYPGLLVMHDPNIHSYALAQMKGGNGMQGYLNRVRDELGEEMAHQVRHSWNAPAFRESMVYEYNMDHWLLKHSRGVIYHSYFAMRDEQQRLPGIPSFYVPLGAPATTWPNEEQRQRILARHQWPPETVIIGTYGIMAPSKRIGILLRAFKEVAVHHPQVVLTIVGSTTHYDVFREAQRLGLEPDRVCVTGEVSMDHFLAYMQAADIGVNLRYPSLGESSAVISRLIGMGKPIVASDIPQYVELPDDFCWKVPVGDKEVEVLVTYLSALIRDRELRLQMGQAALAYARESMSPHLVASGYRRTAEHIFCGGPAPHLEDNIPAEYRQRADIAVITRQLHLATKRHP